MIYFWRVSDWIYLQDWPTEIILGDLQKLLKQYPGTEVFTLTVPTSLGDMKITLPEKVDPSNKQLEHKLYIWLEDLREHRIISDLLLSPSSITEEKLISLDQRQWKYPRSGILYGVIRQKLAKSEKVNIVEIITALQEYQLLDVVGGKKYTYELLTHS